MKQNEMDGAKQTEANERGQELMRAVGMAGKVARQAKHSPQNRYCRQTQPADSPPGSGLKTNERPTVGRPRSKNNSCLMMMAGLSPCR